MRILDWEDVERACRVPTAPNNAIVFGIPRGGIHVAQVLCEHRGCAMADDPSEAEILVDDIWDSGRTAQHWSSQYHKPIWIAFDKRSEEWAGQWIQLPWEKWDDERPAEDSAARLLEALGIDLNTEGTRETPERMVKALRQMTEGYSQDPSAILRKRFQADYDEMILVRDMGFYSLCEHHVLPFFGKVTIGYIATGHVLGLSKMGRLVRCFSRRLQLQERMTQQLAHAVEEELKPLGVGVVVDAHHMCMAMRGSECEAQMTTSSLLGKMRDQAVRAEFLSLAKVRGDG